MRPLSELTRVSKSLIPLIPLTPIVGHLDSMALQLSFDLSLYPLFFAVLFIKVVKLPVQDGVTLAVRATALSGNFARRDFLLGPRFGSSVF